jgi:hypothetical protein
MTAFAYHYRATIYDTDDATVLAPRGGSAHSDDFQITTQNGVSDWLPYIMADPEGRRGTFDRLTGRYSIGEITLKVMDAKVGTDNLERWITAFLGDDFGVNQFIGKKLEIEEYDGSSWTDYFVGRIIGLVAPDPGVEGACFEFVIREETIQAKRDIFVGAPHRDVYTGNGSASAPYVQPSPLLPIGGRVSDWGGMKAVASLPGVIDWNGSSPTAAIMLSATHIASVSNTRLTLLTKALAERADYFERDPSTGSEIRPYVRVRVTRNDTSASGDFYLNIVRKPSAVGGVPYDGAQSEVAPIFISPKGYIQAIGISAIPNDAANTEHPYKYMAIPPDGTAVTFQVYNAGPPSVDAPILINDVHPATLLKDLLDGKFSRLNDSGNPNETNDGEVGVKAIPYDASSISTLEANGTIPKLRFAIDKVWKLEDFITQQITQVAHVMGRVQGDGKVYAKDIRLSSATATGVATIAAADTVSGSWEQGQDSVGLISVKSYEMHPVQLAELEGEEPIKDVPAYGARLFTKGVSFATINATYYPSRTLSIDAQGVIFDGFIATPGEYPEVAVARPFEMMFGTSAAYFKGIFRRTSNTNKWPGDFVIMDLDEIPDAASNERGGSRVMMVLERSEVGPHRTMRFIDCGPNSVAVVPTIDTPVQHTGDEKHSIDVDVTLNASDEPVVLQVAVTSTGTGSAPAADSELWKSRAVVKTTGTQIISSLPSNKRIWVRGYTEVAEKLPSAMEYPVSTGYVDTDAITAPTYGTDTVTGRSVVATWTVGDAAYPLMPTRDGVNRRANPLPAGSTRFTHDENAASTAYTFGVKHVDPYGGESTIATSGGTTTTGTSSTLLSPRGLQILQGRGATSVVFDPPEDSTIGYGFQLGLRITEPHAQIRWQVSQDSGFASIEQDIVTDPGISRVFVLTPKDGILRYMRALHERATFTASTVTATVSAYPTNLLTNAASDSFAGGYAFLSIEDDGTIMLNVDAGDDMDTDRFYYEAARNSGSYPTITDADSFIARNAMPYFAALTVGASNLIGADEIKLAGKFWNAITGFGMEVRDSKRVKSLAIPSIGWDSYSQSGTTGTATVAVDDPDLVVTDLQFRKKLGTGGTSGYASTWDSTTGTIGSSVALLRTESLAIDPKHGSVLGILLTYVIGGVTQSKTIEHYFDPDDNSKIISFSIDFNSSNEVEVTSIIADEDTANVYVTVKTDGTTPADPTSGANDGTMAGVTGTIPTSIVCDPGATARVKVRGANGSATLGPVRSGQRLNQAGAAIVVIESASIGGGYAGTGIGDHGELTFAYSVNAPTGYTVEADLYAEGVLHVSGWLAATTTHSDGGTGIDRQAYRDVGIGTEIRYQAAITIKDGMNIRATGWTNIYPEYQDVLV